MLIGVDKHRLHSHFFILPFKCDKCGNTFMFEHGLRKVNEWDDFLDFILAPQVCQDRYCSICSVEVMAEEERKADNDTAD